MIKRIATAIGTHLPAVALFLVLLFVLLQGMPRAVGQSSERGSDEALASHQQEEIGADRATPPAPTSRRASGVRISAALLDGIDQSGAANNAQLPSAPPVQGAPAVVNCDAEPGIVIHDDGTI